MDCQDYITELVERKKRQHLQREEQGAIQHLKNAGYTNRAIARAIGSLQGEQKAFSETTPNLSLHSLHSLDNGTGQRT